MKIDEVKQWLQPFEQHLTIQEEGNYVTARPKEFLGKELFAKIMAVVRQHGGEYYRNPEDKKSAQFRFSKNPTAPTESALCPHCGKPIKIVKG